MPGLDGLQLCRAFRQGALPVYVHIVLLTAKSSTEEMVEGIDAGADDLEGLAQNILTQCQGLDWV